MSDPDASIVRGPASFVVRGPLEKQGAAAEGVLRALPAWFGIEAAIVDYARAADELPTFVARAGAVANDGPTGDGSGRPSPTSDGTTGESVGFVTLRPTSACAVELHVMGVLREWQRRGVGRALVERARSYARAEGLAFLHVKTLAPSDPDPGYAATRAFYLAMGFRPLEVLPQVWGPENPCLLLVMTV